MVDPTEKDAEHIKDQSTQGYLKYTKEKEKSKINQFDTHAKRNRLAK